MEVETFQDTYCDECPLWWGQLAKHKEPLCDKSAFPTKPECKQVIEKHNETVEEVIIYLKTMHGCKTHNTPDAEKFGLCGCCNQPLSSYEYWHSPIGIHWCSDCRNNLVMDENHFWCGLHPPREMRYIRVWPVFSPLLLLDDLEAI